MRVKKALLLIGSPKRNSNSDALGRYLLDGLNKKRADTEKIFLCRSFKDRGTTDKLISSVGDSDLIILAAPLYVDTLPSFVIRAMELMYRKGDKGGKRFMLIINCGFPEACHNNTAIDISKKFAHSMNYRWLGGLSLGGGEAINGKDIDKLGGLGRNIKKSFDITLAALSEDRDIPKEALMLMSKPIVPRWLFVWLGTRWWKRKAKKFGVEKRLNDRPYL